MDDGLDLGAQEAFWLATQAALQSPGNALVDKPKLSEKLLRKPPFRFLFDVITAVQRRTGFAEDLFDENESDSDSIRDKAAKVRYLSKIFNVVSLSLQLRVPARPQKVVAGLEPEETNMFLQMLARAARQGHASDIVQQVKADERLQQGTDYCEAILRSSSSHQGALPHDPTPAAELNLRGYTAERPSSSGRRMYTGHRIIKSAVDSEMDGLNGTHRAESAQDQCWSGASPDPETGSDAMESSKASYHRPSSARGASLRPGTRGGRPHSRGGAGPDARRPLTTPPPERLTGAWAPGAEHAAPGGDGSDDEGLQDLSNGQGEVPHTATRHGGPPLMQGPLVKDILETESTLKRVGGDRKGRAQIHDEASSTGIVLQRQSRMPEAAVAPSIHTICDMIRKIFKIALPLAKSMEHLQQDVNLIAKEHRYWTKERKFYQDKLAQSQQKQPDMSSIYAEIADADNNITCTNERILSSKAQILQNEETIEKILSMVISDNQ